MFEYKNRADRKDRSSSTCITGSSVLKKERSRLYVGGPERWRNFKPRWALEEPTSPVLAYLRKEL